MVDVTCIIPCHNAAATIVRAVESAIDQVDRIIIIDDSSTDGPFTQIMDNFDSKDAPDYLTTYSLVPSGVCNARNLAITNTKDGLILPLDADDWLVEGAVQKLKESYKPGHFVYGNWYEVVNDEPVEQRPPPITMIRKKNIGYCTFLFHKDDWQAAGGYLPHFNIGGEHWGFMASLIYKAHIKPIYLDTPLFHYNRHAGKRYNRANTHRNTIQALVGEIIDGRA